MFRNRKNSQKPNDVFIQNFQRTYSDVVPSTTHCNASGAQEHTELMDRTNRPNMDGSDVKPNEQFPQTTPDPRLLSLVNPSSLSLLPFANQPNNHLTPDNGRFNWVLHSPSAGDLHTPRMGWDMMNSPSLSQQLFLQSFRNAQPSAQQQSFAPSAFVHRDSGHDAMDGFIENSSLHDSELQFDPSLKEPALTAECSAPAGDYQSLADEKFQYKTILHAPTAMVKSSRDIPISYLNKGQTYLLSVRDSNPPPMGSKVAQYRTFIRVTFQEEDKRSKPAACWQLWREGRGLSEAHQHGGKLQAVEYIDPFQGRDANWKDRQVRVESTSFDGFCVMWTADPNTKASDHTIAIQFNFLSTDFSHSKGVKGVPVRLCAKTQLVSDIEGPGMKRDAEVCYCQVQLFRDHGAERKLSNDVAQVKKTIEKLKQQIMQADMGGSDNRKRKHANASVALNSPGHRPSKITKHKPTWSMDLQEGSEMLSLGGDLHEKLAIMQECFASTCPISSLNLQGDEQDDPDLFPVQLPGSDSDSAHKPGLQTLHGSQLSMDGVMLSPPNSNLSTNSPHHTWHQVPENHHYDFKCQGSLDSSRSSSLPHSKDSPSQPAKVQKQSSDSNVSMGSIEAVDMDLTYQPPERPPKPIACFYLRFRQGETQKKDNFYRAVYLSERSVHDLLEKISFKQCIDPKRIVRVFRIKQDSLKIIVDDDVVRELPDGQAIDVDLSEEFDGTDDSKEPTIELMLSY